jgi:hypothetical protein
MDGFHESYNGQHYEKIYDPADPTFKSVTAASDFTALMASVQRKLGKQLTTRVDGSNLFMGGRVTRVRLSCSSSFEGGPAQEEFVWAVGEGSPRLLAYNINSPVLILK